MELKSPLSCDRMNYIWDANNNWTRSNNIETLKTHQLKRRTQRASNNSNMTRKKARAAWRTCEKWSKNGIVRSATLTNESNWFGIFFLILLVLQLHNTHIQMIYQYVWHGVDPIYRHNGRCMIECAATSHAYNQQAQTDGQIERRRQSGMGNASARLYNSSDVCCRVH